MGGHVPPDQVIAEIVSKLAANAAATASALRRTEHDRAAVASQLAQAQAALRLAQAESAHLGERAESVLRRDASRQVRPCPCSPPTVQHL